MNKEISKIINKIEAEELEDIELLALVTETSYEVVFYAKYEGEIKQSNVLAEDGVISLEFVDSIYEEVFEIVKNSEKYKNDKINILKASDEKISLTHDERDARIYSIKKKWKEEIGINF